MLLKALSFLALLAVLAAASPVPQPQVEEHPDKVIRATTGVVAPRVVVTTGGLLVPTTVGATRPDSVVASGMKGASGAASGDKLQPCFRRRS